MTQDRALDIMLSGRNVFLTGPPGSGKTYLLRKFIKEAQLQGKRVAVTATTGIAATHISGQTINSWAGIGYGKRLKNIDEDALKNRFKNTDVLVIDEISMMNSKVFSLLDIACKINRQSGHPFAGIQVILVGDFFQLPPVAKKDEKVKYAYKSNAWSDLNLSICYINAQFRQKNSDDLTKILASIREGKFGEIEQIIVSTRMFKLPIYNRVIKLLSHNYDVEQINNQELAKLKSQSRIFNAFKWGNKDSLALIRSQVLCPDKLELKVDSEVMFVVNNPKAGYVNGSRGVIKEFKGSAIIIKIHDGGYVWLRRHKFCLDSEIYPDAFISQFPIKLAWGLTIHKSQGMTLDKAVIDLSHAFLPNMGYVALSRLKTIEGLYMRDFNKMAFLINSEIRDVDEQFKKLSDKLTV